MEDLVRLMATSLVDKPEEVEVNLTEEGDTLLIELTAASDDLGRIIGKEGRIAKAIRSVVTAAAIKDGIKVRVDILSED